MINTIICSYSRLGKELGLLSKRNTFFTPVIYFSLSCMTMQSNAAKLLYTQWLLSMTVKFCLQTIRLNKIIYRCSTDKNQPFWKLEYNGHLCGFSCLDPWKSKLYHYFIFLCVYIVLCRLEMVQPVLRY